LRNAALFNIVPKTEKLPFIVWLSVIASGIACVGGTKVLTYNISGLAWVIPLIFSLLILLKNPGGVKFPLKIWLPWIFVIVAYLYFSEFPSLQRSVQLLCPIVIGMAVSTCRFQEAQLIEFVKLCKYLTVSLIIIVLFKSGLLVTGTFPWTTGMAAEVMTGMLLSTLLAARYASGSKKALTWWGLLAAIPVIALTRTAIVATSLTLPLTFAPMKLSRRALILASVCLIGVILFYSPRVQHKMYQHGEGELSDILSNDFSDSGRFHMWENLRAGIRGKPWFGHGAGAGEIFVRMLTQGLSGYPHNDWLLTLYDYGYSGAIVFAVCMILASAHAYRKARAATETGRLLFLAGASSFVPFAMLMYTDNIMVYASFFGNLQFALLGVAYASIDVQKVGRRSVVKIRW